MKRIAITGAAGQIAYSLIFRIASGELLGEEPIALHLLEIPQVVDSLKGLVMELEDSEFFRLKEIKIGSDPNEIFADVDYAFLVGSKPRGPGMERKDLLEENGKIFVEQGKALNRAAKKAARIIIVGNPCNTNCLIAMHHAPDISRKQFHAMTRLDQNRARFQLAKKAKVEIEEVSHVAIWGNHSSTQVPDFVHARICGKPALETIDRKWCEGEFFTKVQKRGSEVIAARGKSSAASAANAALSAMRALLVPTPKEQWFSAGVDTQGNPYAIAEDLVFSFPCRSQGKGDWEIVSKLELDPFLQEKIVLTQKELLEERDLISHLLS